MAKSPTHEAFMVTGEDANGQNGFWTRIGAGWQHGSGDGITVLLDAYPVNGEIVLRKREAKSAGR
jgi:hypothetical protein